MPAEVLVMCTRCGRPQRAGAGFCSACGAELPEAPLPPGASTPAAPFLSAELAGGRVLTGVGNRLSFRPGASATPFLLELPGLRRLTLVHRPHYEVLILSAVALGVLPFVPGPVRVLLGLLALVGVALALTERRYTLVLESSGAVETRWDLGSVRRGSPMEQRVRAAWLTLSDVVRARGVQVSEPSSSRRGTSDA
ncbi:zinc ribbon domain-containing protein [Vitiosangium sp. GDMCC 1.1324]|uniref:zinc ribbon domain-containing protein n=1 Tax=Vitiosangium sp. (strain GDMCC 1.1324) TaxID=2138576 RepID=UPI000D3D53C6|nr:zinc ribbon domain-containing protein [Vitiosangium sp. GDMCC 1.1324]PTL82380.1 hypothetical protein DAT35_16300 [Vitiosangium sp. GDMCC 1.1324]